MTANEMREAREELGLMWGLRRPLSMMEMGIALRLTGNKASDSIRDYERGKTRISGPISLAIELLLAGADHPDLPHPDIG
jgi:hypothetical protein